jgi:hypothetical protein
VLVAGGPENQCRPSVAFVKGNYLVAWMGYSERYAIWCARLSTDGKLLDRQPVALAEDKPSAVQQTWNPVVAAGAVSALAVALSQGRFRSYDRPFPEATAVAMPDGRPGKPMVKLHEKANLLLGFRTGTQSPVAVWTGSAFLVAFPACDQAKGVGKLDAVAVIRADGKGVDLGGEPELVALADNRLKKNPRVSIAFDGKRCLLTEDVATNDTRIVVRGCFLSADGKPLDGEKGAFPIAGDEKIEAMQGFAAAGAEGTFLAVWSEPRGVDDVKVVARIVKP